MTLLGMAFEQAAISFGWGELLNFSKHLPIDSATHRALKPEETKFASDLQQSAILADVFDVVSALNYNFSKAHGGKGRKPEPYPRPWAARNVQKIGSKPIPISEFNDWYYGGE